MTLAWGDLASLASDPAAPAVLDPSAPRQHLAAVALAIARRPDVWRPIIRHDPELRWHCRLADLGDSEVWLLGWTCDQEVEWHDHGGGSGAFAGAEGELHETYTEHGDRRTPRTASCRAGRVRTFGPTRIHHLTNR